MVLLLFSVNKLPKATTKTTAIYNQQYKDVTAKKEVANKEYDVVLKEAI